MFIAIFSAVGFEETFCLVLSAVGLGKGLVLQGRFRNRIGPMQLNDCFEEDRFEGRRPFARLFALARF